mgnify:CR=1 FL=1
MTREEHIKQTEKELARAKAWGDWFSVTSCEALLVDLNKLTDKEYASYIKCRRMYSAASVKAVPVGSYK